MLYPSIQPGEVGVNWDVLVGGMIEVGEKWLPNVVSRSANLWFAKIGSDDSYRWWEVGYMHNRQKRFDLEGQPMKPFSVGTGHSHSGYRPGVHFLKDGYYEPAYNPKLIDGEHFASFCSRWADHFSAAILRKLPRSRTLPEEPVEARFFRR